MRSSTIKMMDGSLQWNPEDRFLSYLIWKEKPKEEKETLTIIYFLCRFLPFAVIAAVVISIATFRLGSKDVHENFLLTRSVSVTFFTLRKL